MAEVTEEQQVGRVKGFLKGWRMALLPLKSILLWEQQWHPCAIVLSLSIFFFSAWLMDLSTIATYAVFGPFINIVDFIVPIICNNILYSRTGQKEKMFEDVCRGIVLSYNRVIQRMYSFYSLRETNCIMFYIISISMLSTMALLASSINDIFLLYIFSTVVLLRAGIQHKGIFQNMLSYIYTIKNTIYTKLANVKSD